MLKIIIFLVLISIIPVYAQNYEENQTIVIQSDPKLTELLQTIVTQQELQIERHENLMKNQNELISEFNENNSEIQISNNEHSSELLVASSTIIGFFGFSSLIIIKFQTNTRIDEKLRLLRSFFTSIGSVILLQILGMISILINFEWWIISYLYAYIFGLTALLFVSSLNSIYNIVKAENDHESNLDTEQNIIGLLNEAISPHP